MKKSFRSFILHLQFNLLLLLVLFTIKLVAWLDIFKKSMQLGKDKIKRILFEKTKSDPPTRSLETKAKPNNIL